MLRELHVSGLGSIEDADLEPHPGLTVLSGETGAGKTMVVQALSLALGARASADLVRPGADAARVQARFEVAGDADGWAEDGEVVLARTVGADGRSSARVGRQLATAAILAELGGRLAEIHGQRDGRRLLDPATQAAFLDRAGGGEHLGRLERHAAVLAELRTALAAREELARSLRDRERELDLLAYQLREIEAVGPRPGETEELEAEVARLEAIERLTDQARQARALLGGDGAAADALAGAASALEAAAAIDPAAGGLAARARAAFAEAAELARDVRGWEDSLQDDPARLAAARERLLALRSLHRRYGPTDAEVLRFADEVRARLRELQGADDRLERLESDLARLREEASGLAAAILERRRALAPELASAVGAALEQLGMPQARVRFRLEAPAAAEDLGGVELQVRVGTGAPWRALARGPSGGELSRVILACRSVVATLDDVPTLVFDEIDAGIGGRTGLEIGRRLAALARERQVLVVTHLAQVACFADLHVRVRKRAHAATLEPLEGGERVRELARMLAGLERSSSAASHAEELLQQAGAWRERIAAGVPR
ncbi:MAG: DNA repair protein RecN [Actinomycetota bacterium]|nr:MAG: DNA repair protein RecN [Actinomycetota bacterium]